MPRTEISQITLALRQERRERFEQMLQDKDPSDYHDYVVEKNRALEHRRNEITGY